MPPPPVPALQAKDQARAMMEEVETMVRDEVETMLLHGLPQAELEQLMLRVFRKVHGQAGGGEGAWACGQVGGPDWGLWMQVQRLCGLYGVTLVFGYPCTGGGAGTGAMDQPEHPWHARVRSGAYAFSPPPPACSSLPLSDGHVPLTVLPPVPLTVPRPAGRH